MSDGVMIHRDDLPRINRAVLAYEDGLQLPAPARRRVLSDASDDKPCVDYWMIWINSTSVPSSGKFDLEIIVAEAAGNTSVTVSVQHNSTAAVLQATLEGQQALLDADGLLCCVLTDGPIHMAGINIHNRDQQSFPHITQINPKQTGITLNTGRPYAFHLVPQASGES